MPNYVLPEGFEPEEWPDKSMRPEDLDDRERALVDKHLGGRVHDSNEQAEADKREHILGGGFKKFGGSYAKDGENIVNRRGFVVYDAEGNEYIDLRQMILCMMIGHDHPEIAELDELFGSLYPGVEIGTTVENNEVANRFAATLREAFKDYGDFLAMFATTGTSANNQAIRLAMGKLGGEENSQLVTIGGSYNGADLAINAECKVPGWTGVTSLKSKAVTIDRDGDETGDLDAKIAELQALAAAGKKPILLLEDGFQGVGGFYKYSDEFMVRLISAVKEMGGVVILDNVQALGRNGAGLLGIDRYGRGEDGNIREELKPDIITLAKGLFNGRVGAMTMVNSSIPGEIIEAVRAEIGDAEAKAKQIGASFDTFSMNMRGIAAAMVVIREMIDKKLWENVAEKGAEFKELLEEMRTRLEDVVEEIVGEGGLIGIKLKTAEQTGRAMNTTGENGILVAKGGVEGTTLRVALPMNATSALVREAVKRLEPALVAARG